MIDVFSAEAAAVVSGAVLGATILILGYMALPQELSKNKEGNMTDQFIPTPPRTPQERSQSDKERGLSAGEIAIARAMEVVRGMDNGIGLLGALTDLAKAKERVATYVREKKLMQDMIGSWEPDEGDVDWSAKNEPPESDGGVEAFRQNIRQAQQRGIEQDEKARADNISEVPIAPHEIRDFMASVLQELRK
jgi:hypothetical protein